jgi:hypothetical protein
LTWAATATATRTDGRPCQRQCQISVSIGFSLPRLAFPSNPSVQFLVLGPARTPS